MSTKEKDNIHGGHRQRMFSRFDAVGPEGFEDHTLLEMLLFYAIPRRDTNELAHALLRRFGSLRGVFEASASQLMQLDGVGENTARMIKIVQALWVQCEREQGPGRKKRAVLDTPDAAGKFVTERLQGEQEECLLLLSLDAASRLICCEELGRGMADQVTVTTREIAQFCLQHGFERILLAHNHPSGLMIPSREDVVMTRKVDDLLGEFAIKLLDHLVVTDQGYYSMKQNGLF